MMRDVSVLLHDNFTVDFGPFDSPTFTLYHVSLIVCHHITLRRERKFFENQQKLSRGLFEGVDMLFIQNDQMDDYV